jgi:hypothetical protein
LFGPSVRPRRRLFSQWVDRSGVSEFTIMVLVNKPSMNLLGMVQEVLHGLHVGDVRVQVVLKLLKSIHVFLDIVESSNSVE